jgi:hypothetical protein
MKTRSGAPVNNIFSSRQTGSPEILAGRAVTGAMTLFTQHPFNTFKRRAEILRQIDPFGPFYGSLRCGRKNSPFGLKQFAPRSLRFAKNGYPKSPNFAVVIQPAFFVEVRIDS